MRATLTIVAFMLTMSATALAQNTPGQSHGLGYVFVGAATSQALLIAGFGGEGYFYKGLGAGVEVASTGWHSQSAGNYNIIGLGSGDVSYHFTAKQFQRKLSPFVSGGFTAFVGRDIDTLEIKSTNGYNLGGGLDVYALRHLGLRLEFRYYGDGGHVLETSFPNVQNLSLATFRIGMTFR